MRHATILLALAAATPARADGDHTLHVAVHGSVDSAAVGAALAKELGIEVTVVDGTCDLPCLDVTVDGKHTATILFAPRSGPARTRSVVLGSDTAQWPLVITLLAGNVVRDEAQDLLAGLPADELAGPSSGAAVIEIPPAPTDEPPPPAAPVIATAPAVAVGVPEHREHRWLGIGFVPGLSTDLTRVGSVRHALSVDVLVGVSGGSSGLTVSGIADIERGVVSGVQAGGIGAFATRVAGTQAAGIVSMAGGVDGVQLAGIASLAGNVEGVQAAGIAAFSRRGADTQAAGIAAVAFGNTSTQLAGITAATGGQAGLQLAGIASLARRDAGVQGAGIVAVSAGSTQVQAAGIASVSRGAAGVQVAGIVNIAGELRGVQVAPFNIAYRGAGTQVGVVNIGGDPDGFSFGLINIVPGGRTDLEAAIDADQIGTVLFRHGGRRWHNVYGIAGRATDEASLPIRKGTTRSEDSEDVWMYGLGFGPSLSFGNTVVDLEAIGWQVNHGAHHGNDVSILGQLRLSVAHRWGPLAIVAGGLINTYITNDDESPLMLERRTTDAGTMDRGTSVTVWPSAFVGVRI
jgi:hypothetical protein